MSQFRKIIAAKNRAAKAKDAKSKPGNVVLSDTYKQGVCEHAYLGKKGYTIPKRVLSEEDIAFLKTDLYVKPESSSAIFGMGVDEPSFAVFRENAAKIYIPRFYGIERYGHPQSSEISDGVDICVNFPNPLRDYQDKIVGVYVNHVSTGNGTYHGGGILEVPCGRGKCLAKDTPVLMYDGVICNVQDLKLGDVIMGDDSGPRTILSLARGREMMYRVTTGDGESYVVNESHILSLWNCQENTVIDISLLDYLACDHESLRGYRVPVEFSKKYMTGDPYTIGRSIYDYTSIPYEYLCNVRSVRLQLLAGILDSFGYYDETNQTYGMHLESPQNTMISDICYLARSLGFPIQKSESHISIRGTRDIPVKRLPRIDVSSVDNTYSITVEPIGIDDYYGFEIDGNHRFVLGDFTVTHNTIMALKIISIIQKKTLIVVHKEFLMNQWIERIRDFLPGATVGKIQGQIMDVDGKDIVIGMIQTLYDKEYPVGVVEQFGLTIVDEVHRIGSEQFSKTLLKTVTPCMLGISATVDRKDKLTKVLYMFIGPKIYTEKREDEDCVCVRAIVYQSDDVEFNQVEHDFRGNPKYSTMIVKLCDFGPRSDFIVRVIADLIAENPENQIMVLGHNRSLLTYLYEAIVHRQIAPVGYYVGGMKQEALQLTETKQVVLATYAMAAEALDIKTLSTLVMITPKTDIIQSVGRILRVKHENPIVVDIVDSHDLFQKQWAQRRRFYKKCNYRIRQIGSRDYKGMQIDWDQDKTWKRMFEPIHNTMTVSLGQDQDDEPPINALAGKCYITLN
jgi:superfamily II DNA or RNA helicase